MNFFIIRSLLAILAMKRDALAEFRYCFNLFDLTLLNFFLLT